MQCLLDMRLTDSTRVFALGMNARRQTPLHIAAQSAQNQPETIRLLQQAMPGKGLLVFICNGVLYFYLHLTLSTVPVLQKLLLYGTQ